MAPRSFDLRQTNPTDDDSSIKVSVRLRALNRKEVLKTNADTNPRAWAVTPCLNSIEETSIRDQGDLVNGQTFFSFDEVFDEDQTTPHVYDSIGKRVVKAAITGHNGTIFAYGQTGSGKTFTMHGSDETYGIVQLAAQDVFQHIGSQDDREFLIRTSYMEIYNETVRDLLHGPEEEKSIMGKRRSPSIARKECRELTVREDSKRGGVYVNCHEVVVTDMESLMDTLQSGEKNRTVGKTEMNAQSSRSHTIFRITIESRERGDDEGKDDQAKVLISTLNLVDLAGSECVKSAETTGRRQREGANINRSLLTLSQVIQSLGYSEKKRPTHINYRDSKLTRILQPSLSGNAVMAILCCATPSNLYLEETRSTLKFASRARLVKTKAKKNEVVDDRALIKRLQRELADAKRALADQEEERRQEHDIKMIKDDEENKPPASVAAREKFELLSSMILRGGLRFDNPEEGENNRGKRKRFNTAAVLREMQVFATDSLDEDNSNDDTSNPRTHGMNNWKPPVPRTVGMMHVAQHLNADITLPIYDQSESLKRETDEEEVFSDGEPSPSPSIGGDDVDAEHDQTYRSPRIKSTGRRRSSERDILKVALASKSEQVRTLQSKLDGVECHVKSLQYQLDSAEKVDDQLRFLETKQNDDSSNELLIKCSGLEAERDVLQAKLNQLAVFFKFLLIASAGFFFFCQTQIGFMNWMGGQHITPDL